MRLFSPARVRSTGSRLGRIKSTVRGFKMPKMAHMTTSIKAPRMGKGGKVRI